MNIDYFIYAVIVVGIFTIYMALVNIFRRDRMRARVQSAGEGLKPSNGGDISSMVALFCASALSLSGVDTKQQKQVTLELWQAGLTSPHAVTYYLFFKRFVQPFFLVAGGVVWMKLATGFAAMTLMGKLSYLVGGGLLLIVGIAGAKLYVANCRQRRQKILLLNFPEALDLLLVCIESGLGMDAALNRVCKEMRATHPVITAELDRTRIELTVMSDRTQALQNLAERTGISQFKSLVSALIQTEKFGTSLLDTLRVLSDDIRTSRLMAAENRAARIPVIITIPLIFCMLPAFVMIILGPPIVRVIEQGGIFGEKHTPRD